MEDVGVSGCLTLENTDDPKSGFHEIVFVIPWERNCRVYEEVELGR